MAFFITSDTANISKVEFNNDSDKCNVAVGWNGNTLLITNVPAGAGSALATLAGISIPLMPAREIYIEIDQNPETFPSGRGTFLQAGYAGRIEIRKPIGARIPVIR